MISDYIGHLSGGQGLCAAGAIIPSGSERQAANDAPKSALDSVRESLSTMYKENGQNNLERQVWDIQREMGIVVQTLCAQIDKLGQRINDIEMKDENHVRK